ncbi:hypothetical protein CUJ84_pRLN3000543 (plasmid) [Rhizobium leguminosarum]|uniref:Uncharacterized protein n=1 Tax=Rhizobium leguminosarum TaxID=384 RepID=A0A2K9ZHD0_RHILE|nr:hypothetical protein CUJ84_pRLN3000543 [Rhizobium leguminosarum]
MQANAAMRGRRAHTLSGRTSRRGKSQACAPTQAEHMIASSLEFGFYFYYAPSGIRGQPQQRGRPHSLLPSATAIDLKSAI